nr:unnamed protein product [Digitaria exilis]
MGEAPRPRSPPRYPDLCGRRRLQLEVHILNRELGFLEEEIQGLERIQPVSRCCKDVNEFVSAKADPMIPVSKRKHGCGCNLFRWIRYPIKAVHMLFMPVLLLPLLAEAQGAKLLQLFLPRHAVLHAELQLSEGPFLQRLLQPVLLPLVLVLRLRRLPRRPRAVPLVVLRRPEAFLLQVPAVVLRGEAIVLLLPRLVPRRPGGAVVSRVLLRLRVLVSTVQRWVPVPVAR